ncbi:hypothetical protein HDA32_003713 [Spinactinospora alkalitolerans]|uniref:Uncharacterized protein n=1 Tax=Spinactinospora alkalitolerans TaxID=687207 RepID=A0A852U0S1_9ACTN|nr:hypothetical protein [Spinactinospora alkalitolerans]NYE48593.1 hypothetical protein [Spinactinospora alkalitolerans]
MRPALVADVSEEIVDDVLGDGIEEIDQRSLSALVDVTVAVSQVASNTVAVVVAAESIREFARRVTDTVFRRTRDEPEQNLTFSLKARKKGGVVVCDIEISAEGVVSPDLDAITGFLRSAIEEQAGDHA